MSLRRIAASPTALWVLAHGGLGGRDGNAPGPGQGPVVSRHGGPQREGQPVAVLEGEWQPGVCPGTHRARRNSDERGAGSLLEPF